MNEVPGGERKRQAQRHLGDRQSEEASAEDQERAGAFLFFSVRSFMVSIRPSGNRRKSEKGSRKRAI